MKSKNVGFSDAFEEVSAGNRKFKQNEYMTDGMFPVVDQGKDLIAGFINDQSVLVTNTPLIVFGDHTRILKFIDFPFAIGADGVKLLKPKTGLDPKYAFYALQKVYIPDTGYNRHFKYFKEAKIPLPDLQTQKYIASILDKADALRQQNRQLLNYYDELQQSTFIEMFGDPVSNNNHWTVKKLDEIAEVVSGVAKNTGLAGDLIEVPYMRVANVQDGALDLREIKTIRVFKRDYEKYQLKSGDVLMTEGGDPDKLGRAAIWGEEIPDCIHQNHIFRVRPNYLVADSEFLCSQFGSIYGKKYFLRAAKQTTGIASINMTQLKNFPVLVPPIEMQKEYKDVVHKIRQQKEILSSEIMEQDMLFETLLAKYFTNN